MAFRLPLERLRWDSARFTLLFESEAEREGHGVPSIQVDPASAHRSLVEATVRDLAVSINACDRFAALTTPLAFIREGNNEYHTFRFINAFYNYYFVLEGLYGRGAWRNVEVERAFASSPVFQRAATATLLHLQRERPKAHSRILALSKPVAAAPTPLEVARCIVTQRGTLHHFANRGDSNDPTPFAHARFEPACELVRSVAILAVTQEMIESCALLDPTYLGPVASPQDEVRSRGPLARAPAPQLRDE